jgi:putative endonuclease
MPACSWIYILTNKNHAALYVGVTSNLTNRVWEHKTKQCAKSFTAKYNVDKLIYYEWFESIVDAIAREKYIKGKTRKWKEALIKKVNPEWNELLPPC